VGAFVGREAELRTIVSVVASSRKEGLARAVEIVGPSGVGKTALAQAVEAHAAKGGWLIAAVVCHRIQSGLPYLLVRRLITATIAALGEQAERYTAGLRAEIDASEAGGAQSNEELFLRLLEGVTLDHSVLLSIDDVQWGDAESRSLIERTLRALAGRSVVLLSTLRPDELDVSPFESRDVQVPLGELTPQASTQLAREYFPGAPDDVITSIVEHAGGRAVDLVTLANMARDSGAKQSEDVAASMRSMVAQDVGLLTKDVREFLQLCALIAEPIELSILQQLWPDDRTLLQLIERASGRYLLQHGRTPRFAHAAIAQAIRETIPIEIPFRRRIIDALSNLPNPRLEDFERMADQAAACGDRFLERSCMLQLAEAAERESAYSLVATSMERALQIAPPESQHLVAFYTRLSMAYNYLARLEENIRTLRAALSRAERDSITDGIGALVASLLTALANHGDRDEAESVYLHYEPLLNTTADRSLLLAYKGMTAVFDLDMDRFAHIMRQFTAIGNAPHPMASVRLLGFSALLKSRSGNYEGALRQLASLRDSHQHVPAAYAASAVLSRLITFQHQGPAGVEGAYGQTDDPRIRENVCDSIRIAIAQAKEDAEDVAAQLVAAHVRYKARHVHRSLDGLLLQANVLLAKRILVPEDFAIREAVREFTENPESTRLPLVAAWCVSIGERDREATKAIISQMLATLEKPLYPDVLFIPLVLVIAAQRAGDLQALTQMTDPSAFGNEAGAWNMIQRTFAAAVASTLVDKAAKGSVFSTCAAQFAALGAPLFARLAGGDWRALTSNPLMVDNGAKTIEKKPTRREREVAALVTEGITNREIAERLFLSERTVEAHLANIFAKVNVSSRTQLASWFIKNV